MLWEIQVFGIFTRNSATCLQSEMVILCQGRAFMCKVENELVVVVPNVAHSGIHPLQNGYCSAVTICSFVEAEYQRIIDHPLIDYLINIDPT